MTAIKIGIYGGTFNPPHWGHLAAARAVMHTLRLDRLLLIPAGTPPHKVYPVDSPDAQQRFEMTCLAAESLHMDDQIQVLDLEIRRNGRSFTSDTLAELREIYPDDELWLLTGSDMFLSLTHWHEPEKILALASIAAFGRQDAEGMDTLSAQREKIYRQYPGARIFTLDIPDLVNISSSELRERLAAGKGRALLPPAVYGYILREKLYGTQADLKHLSLEQLRGVALTYLHPKRVPHVLGTEQEAVRLAIRYGANPIQASVAALLHDSTKRLELPEQLALCEKYHIILDNLEKNTLKLLHAKTGAALARDVFGVSEELSQAIYWHTTGHAHMTLLEKIIYLADYIEPSRHFPGVDQLRNLCYKDLDQGLRLGLQMTIDEMESENKPVHHATLEARDALKGQIGIEE